MTYFIIYSILSTTFQFLYLKKNLNKTSDQTLQTKTQNLLYCGTEGVIFYDGAICHPTSAENTMARLFDSRIEFELHGESNETATSTEFSLLVSRQVLARTLPDRDQGEEEDRSAAAPRRRGVRQSVALCVIPLPSRNLR